MSYWDTFALLKLYLQEADSGQYAAIALSSTTLTSCFIGKLEARTAFRRRETEGVLPSGGATLCHQKLSEDVALGRINMVFESVDLEREFGLVIESCLSQTPPVFIARMTPSIWQQHELPVRQSLSPQTSASVQPRSSWDLA